MQKYLTRVWAVRYFCISPMGSIPEGVQGASGKPPGRTRRCEIPCETRKSKEDFFPCLSQGICFLRHPFAAKGPKVSKGRAESPLVASAEAKPSVKHEEVRKVFPLPSTRNLFFCATPLQQGPEGFQRASGKPFGRLRRGETLRKTGRSKEGLFLAFHKKSVFCATPLLQRGRRFPKGDRKALWSPPQRRNPL